MVECSLYSSNHIVGFQYLWTILLTDYSKLGIQLSELKLTRQIIRQCRQQAEQCVQCVCQSVQSVVEGHGTVSTAVILTVKTNLSVSCVYLYQRKNTLLDLYKLFPA